MQLPDTLHMGGSATTILLCSKGAGSACLLKPQRMEQIVRTMSAQLSCPLTFKMRKVSAATWALKQSQCV